MIKGFRTLVDAIDHEIEEEVLTQNERLERWNKKEPIYAEFEALYPGEVDDVKNLQMYKIFWRDRIVSCPAWRCDRTKQKNQKCNSMAIVVHKDEEGSLIICPECEYAGELFHA